MTTVILGEDDPDSLDVLSQFLQIHGLNIIGMCVNGKECIEMYEQFPSDVVIMDVLMPDFDGFYGLEGIKKINSDAIVIMITADLSDKTHEKLKALNASQIFYKPHDLDKIVPTIERFMEEKSPSTQFQIST